MAIPVFSISIQINPDFAKFFNAADMAQIEVKRIDPAVLKRTSHSEINALSLDDVYDQEIVDELFSGEN